MTHAGEALKYLHEEEEIIHCDIKPEHFGLSGTGYFKLFDFGNSRDIGDSFTKNKYTKQYFPDPKKVKKAILLPPQ